MLSVQIVEGQDHLVLTVVRRVAKILEQYTFGVAAVTRRIGLFPTTSMA